MDKFLCLKKTNASIARPLKDTRIRYVCNGS